MASFFSANPTLLTDPKAEGGGPAPGDPPLRLPKNLKAGYETLLPEWDGKPPFKSRLPLCSAMARGADHPIQQIGYDYAEWSFRGRDGRWGARGRLAWPPKEETGRDVHRIMRNRTDHLPERGAERSRRSLLRRRRLQHLVARDDPRQDGEKLGQPLASALLPDA